MAKAAKSGAAQRSARTGRFVTRGAKVGKFTAMGTAADGTVIVAPAQKPKSFTVSKVRQAVRAVKDEQRDEKARGAAS